MKIALLGPANVIHYQRWAHGLAAMGHEVHVISQHPDRSINESLAFASQTWLPIKSTWGYAGNIPTLLSAIARIQPDIVNTHYASGYGLCASMITGYPHLLSVWGSDVYDFPNESWLKKEILLWNLKRATAIASTSHAMERQVNHLLPGARSIYITPFGVDCKKFSPDIKPPNTPLTIGIVKTFAPKYGIDILIRAFAKLLALPSIRIIDAQRPLKLLLVGDGPDRELLTRLVAELGIWERVQFAGHIAHDAVPMWLRKIDIFVVPSRLDSESFGVSAIEASACEIPVIVSDVGGLPEVVDDGLTGIVTSRENIQELTFALEKLTLNPELRTILGKAGRRKVLENYEWGNCVKNMIHCYEKIIENNNVLLK